MLPGVGTLGHMRRFRIGSAALVMILCLGAGAAELRAAETSVEDVTARLVALYAEPGTESATALRERVDAGVPPGALLVLLDTFRAAPRSDLVDVVRMLSGYRGLEVRARALAAWASLGGSDAIGAIALAAEDTDPLVRRLAVALAVLHPSAPADEIVAALLRDDPELAAQIAAGDQPLVPEDPQ
jgi:hypothetical protein